MSLIMHTLRVIFTTIIALLLFAPSVLATSQAQTAGGQPVRALIASSNISSRIAYGQSYDLNQQAVGAVTSSSMLKEPTPTPTALPTATPTPQPAVSVVPSASGGNLDAEALFAMSNAYRVSLGLAPFEKDERLCQLARERAPEVMPEVTGGYMHKGLYDRPIPYWITENIVTMASIEQAFHWWSNHGIHKAALEGSFTHSCVACAGIACAQEFSNFQPK